MIKDQCNRCANNSHCSGIRVYDSNSCPLYRRGIDLEKHQSAPTSENYVKPTDIQAPENGTSSYNNNDSFIYYTSMFSRPFSFKGRIRRTEFGISFIILWVWSIIVNIWANSPYIDGGIAIIVLLSYIPALWFYWAQICKRFHDRGKSGLEILFLLIPFYNIYVLIMLLFADGDIGDNEYGTDPKGRSY